MTYSTGIAEIVPPMVSPYTFGWSPVAHERLLAGAPASANSDALADRAAYSPVLVPTTTVVRRLWWANGDTVNASYNIDVGIYADAGFKPGTRVVSAGNTAQGTASQVQFVDVTDTTLTPGLYWLAIVTSTSSATLMSSAYSHSAFDAAIQFQQANARPLPATATPVERSVQVVYLYGFATTASP